jgi:hypothetical protein
MTIVQLTGPRQRLVELMRRIKFGRIERLVIRGGEPVINPPPQIVREHKFGVSKPAQPHPQANASALKSEVVELFETLSNIQDGEVQALEVRHGLPFRLVITDALPELEQS